MTPTWHGALDVSGIEASAVAQANRLADAAKAGRWPEVFQVLDDAKWTRITANLWRPHGKSWYTPLHQAAWHGAPVEVARRLLDAGAWRTLRTAKGQRALDIATEKGHRHLLECLTPEVVRRLDSSTSAQLETQLARLVESRIRPQLEVPMRHPSVDVLTELPDSALWYPVPGMYGGFSVELRENHLYVESWSRVVGGSGQAHVVTAEGFVLVNSGFV